MARRNPHELLDDLKPWPSQITLSVGDLHTIRAKSLANRILQMKVLPMSRKISKLGDSINLTRLTQT